MDRSAGVNAKFIVDDLTNLRNVGGVFDLLIDYGTMDDLNARRRELYLRNVLPLTRPGSMFPLYAHEWSPRWWERPLHSSMAFAPGGVECRFGDYFEIQRIAARLIGEIKSVTSCLNLQIRQHGDCPG